MFTYKPYQERKPDTQHQNTLKEVLETGIRSQTQQRVDTFSFPYPVTHRYDLTNGFPWDTSRSIKTSGFMAINELMAFVKGVHENSVLNQEWEVPFWNSTFEDPAKCAKRGLKQGDLGPASYGPVLHDFPKRDGGSFNQIRAVVQQINELPHLKTHVATTLYPPEIFRGKGLVQKVVTVPCHGTVIYFVVLNGKLHMTMVQRSGDLLPGVPHNKIQYAALFLAVGQVTGYTPGIFSHTILNPHIYENQVEHIKEIIRREPISFPTVYIKDSSIKDIELFRKEHFALEDYHPHPAMKDIPVAT